MLSGRSFSRSMSIRLDFLRSKASSSLQLLDVGLLESPVRLRREFFLWRGRLKEKKFECVIITKESGDNWLFITLVCKVL